MNADRIVADAVALADALYEGAMVEALAAVMAGRRRGEWWQRGEEPPEWAQDSAPEGR